METNVCIKILNEKINILYNIYSHVVFYLL
jgi:hypothetical protein